MSAFDENPFADPSVQQATAANPAQAAASLDNYDPFSQQKTTTTSGAGGAGGGGGAGEVSGPAVMSPTQESNPPPPYNRSAQQTVTAADFQVGLGSPSLLPSPSLSSISRHYLDFIGAIWLPQSTLFRDIVVCYYVTSHRHPCP